MQQICRILIFFCYIYFYWVYLFHCILSYRIARRRRRDYPRKKMRKATRTSSRLSELMQNRERAANTARTRIHTLLDAT